MFPFERYHPDEIVHITMPHPPEHEPPPWVRVTVREDLDPVLDCDVVNGIPCTSLERTIVDLGEEWSVEDVAECIRRASMLHDLDVAKLEDTIRRVHHPRAKRVAAEALELWRNGLDIHV